MRPPHAAPIAATLVAMASAAWLGLASPAAQPQTPTFRTSVDVIRLDVLVIDGSQPVTGLSASDFEVADNGVRQRVEVVSLEDASIDVVLALDTSSSVSGRLLTQLTAAAEALVNALDSRDRAALLTFSNTLAVRSLLTVDRERIRQALAGVRAYGSTSIVDALSAAISLPGATGRPTLLLAFSDGLDTASWLTPSQVLDQARRSDIVIDGVIVGSGRGVPVEELGSPRQTADPDHIPSFLPRVTTATGGRLLDGSRGERLSGAFVDALRSFRQRYEITYSPEGPQTPGWHAIEVRVKGRTSLTIRARPGYLR
jgi:Ca-activated chloride channel family protein